MRKPLVIGLVLLGLLLAACDGGAPAQTPTPTPTPSSGTTHQVTIQNFAFSPSEITIKAGDTVTWTSRDLVPHTVTQVNMEWHSGDVRKDQTFSRTFDAAGTFDYACIYHPYMQGRVIVE